MTSSHFYCVSRAEFEAPKSVTVILAGRQEPEIVEEKLPGFRLPGFPEKKKKYFFFDIEFFLLDESIKWKFFFQFHFWPKIKFFEFSPEILVTKISQNFFFFFYLFGG
jgi:hypothetical protein